MRRNPIRKVPDIASYAKTLSDYPNREERERHIGALFDPDLDALKEMDAPWRNTDWQLSRGIDSDKMMDRVIERGQNTKFNYTISRTNIVHPNDEFMLYPDTINLILVSQPASRGGEPRSYFRRALYKAFTIMHRLGDVAQSLISCDGVRGIRSHYGDYRSIDANREWLLEMTTRHTNKRDDYRLNRAAFTDENLRVFVDAKRQMNSINCDFVTEFCKNGNTKMIREGYSESPGQTNSDLFALHVLRPSQPLFVVDNEDARKIEKAKRDLYDAAQTIMVGGLFLI